MSSPPRVGASGLHAVSVEDLSDWRAEIIGAQEALAAILDASDLDPLPTVAERALHAALARAALTLEEVAGGIRNVLKHGTMVADLLDSADSADSAPTALQSPAGL